MAISRLTKLYQVVKEITTNKRVPESVSEDGSWKEKQAVKAGRRLKVG